MMALSLLQPWAHLWALGIKEYETRSWKTDYRGLLVIHASKKFTKDELYYAHSFSRELARYGYVPSQLPLGAAVGLGELIDCVPTTRLGRLSADEYRYGDFSPRRYAWQLANVQVFKQPIPVTGSLGLWKWTLPIPEWGR